MIKLQEGQLFRTLCKVETLSKGEEWVIVKIVESKRIKYYKLSLDSLPYRCIAIISFEVFHDALEKGFIQLLGKKKIKISKEKY